MHLAAEGGSLELLRWLVDDLGCPLYDEDDQPLRTQPRGDSVLGVASRQRHAHVMRWLVAAKECKVGEIADRAQLVAAVEFLLLGGESGASSGSGSGGSGGGAYALPPPSSSRRSRRRMLEDEEGEEEVKQQEVVSDYGSGEDEDDPEDLEVIRQLRKGHGLSTRPATATAAGRLGKGKQQRQQQRQRQRGEEAPPEGARCVDDCLLCGVRLGMEPMAYCERAKRPSHPSIHPIYPQTPNPNHTGSRRGLSHPPLRAHLRLQRLRAGLPELPGLPHARQAGRAPRGMMMMGRRGLGVFILSWGRQRFFGLIKILTH